ncbi:hypothetical protein PFISCL1PPCAC_28058, partial [Pristionchus fissidentatus]
SYYLVHNNNKEENVVCNMKTQEIMTKGGAVVEANSPFSCDMCMCPTNELSDQQSACPFLSLCVKPTSEDACKATCPDGAQPSYLDANNMMKPSATIDCLPSDEWIEAGATQITCQFTDPSKGYKEDPPVVNIPCPKLNTFSCGSVPCMDANLVYVKTPDGYRATCTAGAIFTDKSTPGVTPSLICLPTGMWEDGVSEANCRTDADAIVNGCIAMVTDPITRGILKGECAFGTCVIKCMDPAAPMLQYEDYGGVMGKAPALSCLEGDINAPSGEQVNPMKVTCVA